MWARLVVPADPRGSLATIPLPVPHLPIVGNRYLIQKDRKQQVILYWYQSQRLQVIAREVAARIAMDKSALVRQRTDVPLSGS